MRLHLSATEYWLTGLFAVVWVALLHLTLKSGLISFQPGVLSGDPKQYTDLAASLAQHGIYSIDGIHPFFEREPGYSVFIALIYLVFGISNVVAVYAAQALLHLASSLVFARSIRSFVSTRASLIVLGILLFFPAVHHVLFSLTRESVALSVGMLFMASLLRLKRTGSLTDAVIAGLLFGYLFLLYAVFLLFPIFLVIILLLWKVRWQSIVVCIIAATAVMSIWGVRNYMHTGMTCMTGCYRAALQWYVRGEQAEHIGVGMEPMQCLLAEYVRRDYTGRSPYCNFNAVWHAKWPEGFVGTPADALVTKEGQAKILANLPNYLWFSLFEVVELHLPYVNGWGRVYNMLAVVSTFMLYLGCLCSIPKMRTKEYLLIGALIGYVTGLFALTDAIPRYLLPIIFCYAVLAGIGYDVLITRLWRR